MLQYLIETLVHRIKSGKSGKSATLAASRIIMPGSPGLAGSSAGEMIPTSSFAVPANAAMRLLGNLRRMPGSLILLPMHSAVLRENFFSAVMFL